MKSRNILLSALFVGITLISGAADGSTGNQAIKNAGFEQAASNAAPLNWKIKAGGHKVTVTDAGSAKADKSLYMAGGAEAKGTFVSQQLSSQLVAASPIAVSVKLRTRGIQGSAGLVIIVNGPQGRLFVDDMRGRSVTGDTPWTTYKTHVPALPTATSITIGALVFGTGEAWFDDFALKQIQQSGPVAEEVQQLADEFFTVLETRYIEAERLDMASLRNFAATGLQGASSYAEAYPVFKAVVAQMDAPHAAFISASDMAQRLAKEKAGEHTLRSASSNEVLLRIDNHIAYLNVPKFPGLTDPDADRNRVVALEQAITSKSADALCGWILDFRDNAGGSMWSMLDGLQPFLPDEIVLGGNLTKLKGRATWWSKGSAVGVTVKGESKVTSQYGAAKPWKVPANVPVAILINGYTASAAEMSTIAVAARKNAIIIGEPSGGYLSANIPIPLSDGSRFVLPVARTLNHKLERVEQIFPDIRVADEGEAIMHAASKWIKGQETCSLIK